MTSALQGHQAVVLDLDGDAQPDVAVIDVNDNNQLAMRTANNFGFRMEGQLRSHIFTGGEYVDQWVLGLLKDEYEKISIVSRWKARREN